jgi:hypothetical protein
MNHRFLLGLATTAAIGLSVCSGASAFEPTPYTLSGPASHGNLSVYPVHGAGNGGPAPLTLEEALASGAAKISVDKNDFTIQNFSGREIFIQAGDLIRGGLQDQVISSGLLLGPGSGPTSLAVFCVDQGRSVARGSEDPAAMTATGALIPSQTARLIMLSGAAPSAAVADLQQVGVWLSASAIEQALSRRIGAPVTTERSGNSLPLALEHEGIARALEPAVGALAKAVADPDVIGAVFVVNGKVVGAEIYGSNALFAKAWPKLLGAYATAAMGAETADPVAPPTLEAVTAFLAAAEQGQARPAMGAAGASVLTRDSADAYYSVMTRPDDSVVHRSYVARFADAGLPLTREATTLRLLDLGVADLAATATRYDMQPVLAFVDTLHGFRMAHPEASASDLQRAAAEYSLSSPYAVAVSRFAAYDAALAAERHNRGASLPFVLMMLIPILLALASLRLALKALFQLLGRLAFRLARGGTSILRRAMTAISLVSAIVVLAVLRFVRTGSRMLRAAFATYGRVAAPARLAAT